jgi:ankyrin repeat protein
MEEQDLKNRALLIASKNGDISQVNKLLDVNADVNTYDADNTTPLYYAIRNGHLNVARTLLSKKHTLKTLNLLRKTTHSYSSGREYTQLAGREYTQPVLILAIQNGYLDIAKLLLKLGVDPNLRGIDIVTWGTWQTKHVHEGRWERYRVYRRETYKGNTALMEASELLISKDEEHNLTEVLKLLVKNGADLTATNDHYYNHGYTAFMLASKTGNLPAVKFFIKEAKLNGDKEMHGWTALMEAIDKEHPHIVEFLLMNGANVNASGKKGTPLMIAVSKYNSDPKIVKLLMRWGADPNIRQKKLDITSLGFEGLGSTPLFYAYHNRKFNIIKEMIDGNLDLESSLNGETLLTTAVKSYNDDSIKIAKLLVNSGADFNAPNMNGYTPFVLASEKGSLELIELMKKKGADVNARDEWGNTALIMASMNGHLSVVKFLLNDGADVNAANREGYTALMLASERGHFIIVDLLIDAGADVNAKNIFGYTALMYASREGEYEVVSTLIRTPLIDLKAANQWKETSLILAEKKGHSDIVELLMEPFRMEGRKQMKKRFTITKREYKTIIQIGKRFIDFYKRCCDNVVLSSLQKRVVFFEILDMFSKFALGSYPIDADVPEIFEIKCLKIAYIGFVFSEALEGEKARQKTDDYIREQCKKIKSLTDDEIEIFIDFLKTRSWKFEEDEDVYAMCEYILSVSQRIETKRMIRIMEFLEAENAHSMIEKMENLLKEIPECLEQFKTLFDRAEESWKKLQEHKKIRQIEEDRKMAALLQGTPR